MAVFWQLNNRPLHTIIEIIILSSNFFHFFVDFCLLRSFSNFCSPFLLLRYKPIYWNHQVSSFKLVIYTWEVRNLGTQKLGHRFLCKNNTSHLHPSSQITDRRFAPYVSGAWQSLLLTCIKKWLNLIVSDLRDFTMVLKNYNYPWNFHEPFNY